MAEFATTFQPDYTPNVLFDPTLAGRVQAQNLQNQAAQQQITNDQTFRNNAGGLMSGDPTASALALGANPVAGQNYINSIPYMDANKRAQAQSDLAASTSMAGAVLNAPPEQRAAAWAAGRQTLIASGHKMVPPEQYPGDGPVQTMRGMGLTAQEQFEQQANTPTTNPQPFMQTTPGGGYVGPGGTVQAPNGGGTPGPQSSTATANPTLAATENPGGNPATMNKQGHVGNYQFGSGRLASLGMYQAAQGENPNGNTWQGQFSIPGFPQVKTLADFRASAPAQDAAYQVHQGDIQSAIAATPGADAFDQNGLIAVAHLGGVGGMQKFVASGGRYNPGDANGTTLANYYQKFSGKPTQVAANVPQQPVATDASGAAPPSPPMAPPMVSPLQASIDRLRTQANQPGVAPAPQTAPAPQAPTQSTNVLSSPPVPSAPYDPNSVVNVDSLAAGAGFPVGTPMRTPDGQVTIKPPSPMQAAPQPSSPPQSSGNILAGMAAPPSAPSGTNALASGPIGSMPQPQQPNALSGYAQPQPGTQGAPGASPTGIPPGYKIRTLHGLPIPGREPGYIQAVNPQGQLEDIRMPGFQPKLTVTDVGGTLVQTDPNTGAIVSQSRIGNTGRLVSGPDGSGGTQYRDPNGNVVANGPSNTGHELQMQDYTRDQPLAQSAAEELNQAKQTDFAIREQRGITSGLTQTGAYGQRKAALASYLESTFSPATAKAFEAAAGLDDASQSEQFAKTALGAAGAQENANVGARGGFQLTKLYTSANPGLGSQPNTIRDIQNLQAVSNLNQQDYLQGLIGYINQNSTAFRNGGQYSPATNFSQQWNGGNNPQVYVAAAEALNQKPFAKWSRGLSDADQQRALSIAARADNTAQFNGKTGPAALTQYGAQPQQSAGAPPGAVSALRQNPQLAAQFDAKYGQGASQRAMAQ